MKKITAAGKGLLPVMILALLLSTIALPFSPAGAAESTADYYTIKYDSAGNKIWAVAYDGGQWDYAYGVAVDSQSNIIVTGASEVWHDYNGNGTEDTGEVNDDYLTIKYSPEGEALWNRTFDNGSGDVAYAVAVDGENNIIVGGSSSGNFCLIKYRSDGTELWNRTYDGGGSDGINSVAVDAAGNITASGYSMLEHEYHQEAEAVGTGNDILTNFSLEHPPITPQSVKIYLDGIETTDYQIDSTNGTITFAAVPGKGVVITADYDYKASNLDYCTIKCDAGGSEIWKVFYDGGRADGALKVVMDSQGNIIVTGASEVWHDYNGNSTEDSGEVNTDYCTIKYDADGNEIWKVFYDSGHDDVAYGAAVDSAGNAIVTGSYSVTPAAESGSIALPQYYNYTTIKYDSDGRQVWDNPLIYHGVSQECAYKVATDSQDNIIVTGKSSVIVTDNSSATLNWNFYTIKYDSSGNKMWDATYDGGEWDAALDVVTDGNDNIIVTGASVGGVSHQGDNSNGGNSNGSPEAGGGLSTGAKVGIAVGACTVTGLIVYYLLWMRGGEASQSSVAVGGLSQGKAAVNRPSQSRAVRKKKKRRKR